MNDLQIIRQELKDIRYYYSRKAIFDEAKIVLGETHEIVDKAKQYNKIMLNAPPDIYDIYYSLYVKNNTQESLADLLGFTVQYIQKLNEKIVQFIYTKMMEE